MLLNGMKKWLRKLNGAVHQIGDLEAEKVRVMTKSYRAIEERIETELIEKIPAGISEDVLNILRKIVTLETCILN